MSDGMERPDGWPEMFPDPDLDCNHQYQWDNADGCYRCMYCDIPRDKPPERYLKTEPNQDS